jgi:hypothetical protein
LSSRGDTRLATPMSKYSKNAKRVAPSSCHTPTRDESHAVAQNQIGVRSVGWRIPEVGRVRHGGS